VKRGAARPAGAGESWSPIAGDFPGVLTVAVQALP